MAITKRELVDEAFEELAIGGAFNVAPEDKLRALRRLEAIVARWESLGIALGYALPVNPTDSDLDDDSGIADRHALALQLNLAIALAPSFGKAVAAETKTAAKAAYDDLLREATTPDTQQMRGGMPMGAGNKAWRGGNYPATFTAEPDAAITSGGDELEL
jgi:hypothetical protein